MAWFRSIQEGGDVDKTPPANGNILQYYSSTRTWQLVSIATLSLQPLNANLGSLSSLTYSAISFVKMTGANTFGLDTSVYLNLDQTTPQSVTGGRPHFVQGVTFGTAPTVGATLSGKLYWDAIWNTLSLNLDSKGTNLQIGQESMIRVIAGENITNGDACYIYSASGVYPIVKKAIATAGETARVKGIATETFATSTQGFITNFGIINDLNTNSWNIGDLIYLSSSTAGALTNTKPTPPNLQTVIGRVIVKDASAGSIYRSASPNYPISGDQVDLQSVGTGARHSVQDLFNSGSVGMISGGTIANAGSQQITVGSGTGIIAIGTLDTDPVCFCSWSAKTATTVTDARVTWVTVQYNSGSPQIVLIEGSSATDYAVPAAINYQDVFPLGYVTRNGTELYVTNNPRRMQDGVGGLMGRFYQTLPLARDEKIGGLIIGETGTRNITMSAGKLWDRQNQFSINAIDTSAAGTGTVALVFSTWQRDGGTGNFIEASNTKAWPNTQYDLNGVLTSVPSNRWANLWWYLSTEGYLAMVYGRAIYTSAAAAAAGAVPSTLPLPLWTHFRLIARTTFKGSDATFTAIDSAFTNTFQPSAAATHNNLSGLQGGTAAEYYHLTSPQHATLTTIAAQNFVFAGPTSGTGPAVYRALVSADIPTLNQNTTGSAGFSQLSATATWALLAASANYAIQAGTASYSINSASAAFAVAFTDAPSDGKDYGRKNGSWQELTFSTGAGTGTVTEVDLALPNTFVVNPAQVITAGTLTAAWITTIAQNYIFAAPTSGTGGPAFRAMDAADVPTLNQNTTGSAGYAQLSATATWALLAASANYAIQAGTASYAILAATATWGILSASANYALQAALAATATFAITSATCTSAVLKDGTVNPANLLTNGDFENWSSGLNGDGYINAPDLVLTGENGDTSQTIIDLTGKTITNTFASDTYSVLIAEFNGTDGTQGYTALTGQVATFASTAQLDTAQRKFGTASLLLNGTTDRITFPASTTWDFGSGDFTIDAWIRLNATTTVYSGIFNEASDGGSNFLRFHYNNTHYLQMQIQTNGTLASAQSNTYGLWTPALSTWYHVACVRSGNEMMLFVDGVKLSSLGSDVTGKTYATLTAGGSIARVGLIDDGPSYFNGWIDELRVSKGIARWTSNFIVPQYPYGFVSNATAAYKYETGSLWFDGCGSNCAAADAANWDFATADFSIDAWIKLNSLPNNSCICTHLGGAEEGLWGFRITSLNQVDFFGHTAADWVIKSFTYNTFATGTWYHIAVTRATNVLRAFVDGTQIGSDTAITDHFTSVATPALRIGGLNTEQQFFDGYIDNLRITKGVALWTANFVPPATYNDWYAPYGWTRGGGISTSRESLTTKISNFSSRVINTGVSGRTLYQSIVNASGKALSYWQGKTVSIGCWVKSSVVGSAYIQLYDGITAATICHSGGGNWEFLKTTANINNAASEVTYHCAVVGSSDNSFFDGAICVEGASPFAFFPKPASFDSVESAFQAQTFASINPMNLLYNGSFECWSAGTTSAPDGWSYTGAGGSTARESTIIREKTYSAKITRSGTDCYLLQDISATAGNKGMAYWKGRTITFGCWVYATIANSAIIRFNDGGSSTTDSATHPGDSTWRWLTVTQVVNQDATVLYAMCKVQTNDTSAYYDGAMFVEGSSSFAYAERPAEEGVWANYYTAATVLGWSVLNLAAQINIKRIGKTVFVQYDLNGTSNSTRASFTVPYAAVTSATFCGMAGQCMNNTAVIVNSNVGWQLLSGSTQIIFQNTWATVAGGWTNTGQKYIRGELWYEGQ